MMFVSCVSSLHKERVVSMCNFLSAIVFRNGRILCDPEHTDSHSDLIAANRLTGDEDIHIRKWIRVEFTSSSLEKIAEPDSYTLKIDETSTPDWFDDAKRFDISEQLRDRIRAMIIADSEIPLLLGGCWILADKANVHAVRNARIISMRGTSRVGTMCENSRVGTMRESSQVGTMRGSSRVGTMRESSQVGTMRESSQVGTMRESSQVGEMRGNSRVGGMWGNSQVGEMRGNSRVGEMWGNSQAPKAPTVDLREKIATQA